MEKFNFEILLPKDCIDNFEGASTREKDRFKRRIANMFRHHHETSKAKKTIALNQMRTLNYMVKTISTNAKQMIKRISDIEGLNPTHVVRLAIADLIGLPPKHVDRKFRNGGAYYYRNLTIEHYIVPHSYTVRFKDGDKVRTNTKFKLGREDAAETNKILRHHVARWCVERLATHGEQP